MKEIINIKDRYKMLIIYFITTIISMIIAGFLVEYDYIQSCLRNYLWPLIVFTISFLILIRLFKVKFKSVLIFFRNNYISAFICTSKLRFFRSR